MATSNKERIIIVGAAGRDFHNFNVFFRDNPSYEVVAFTAAQIPNIEGRRYPMELAGSLYPEGIPIFAESDLPRLIKKYDVDCVVFSYSDILHEEVMHKASIAMAGGATFWLLGPKKTMLKSKKPVISVCAVRTGSGKSQTTRKIIKILTAKGKKVVVVRHPMPYGDLRKQICQRFATFEDLDRFECTIEEREEYEPLIRAGVVVYAGVDYGKILASAEEEADIIIWDGGNNDIPFFKPDLHIVLVDPHRAGHELKYFPGETNFRMADVIIVNKVETANAAEIKIVKDNIATANPTAVVIEAASPIMVDNPDAIRGKKVLVVEDGPTVTHGEMPYGAGLIAAERFGAAKIIEPEPFSVGSIKRTFKKYPHIKKILPAMGYGTQQIKELEETINAANCDIVVEGTPISLDRILHINKPIVKVSYELDEIGRPNLEDVLKDF